MERAAVTLETERVKWPNPDVYDDDDELEKLVHIFGSIIRIYHDARSPERQIR